MAEGWTFEGCTLIDGGDDYAILPDDE